MRALSAAWATLCLAVAASATPEHWATFQKAHGVKPGSALMKAECSTCHTEVPKRNPFGAAVQGALRSAKTEVLTQAILLSAEKADADGDGWPSAAEIEAGFLPGDKGSRPKGSPPMEGMDHGAGKGPEKASGMVPGDSKEALGGHSHASDPREGALALVPKHSLHPVLVHFPIALFLFGAFLEVLGSRTQRPSVREAGYWNLLAGSASTTVSIATGLVAALRMGYELVPGTPVFIHLSLAILASLSMLTTVLWRRKGAHEGLGYFALLLLSAALVGAAGHFGGGLVYG